MTAIDVASPEARTFAETSLRWLNMKVNQIRPFTLQTINSASKADNGHIALNVTLVTEAFKGRDFVFDLVLDPSVNNPTALVQHKQLN